MASSKFPIKTYLEGLFNNTDKFFEGIVTSIGIISLSSCAKLHSFVELIINGLKGGIRNSNEKSYDLFNYRHLNYSITGDG